MSASLSAYGANTPTLALPTRGREEGASSWTRSPSLAALAGDDTSSQPTCQPLCVILPVLGTGPA